MNKKYLICSVVVMGLMTACSTASQNSQGSSDPKNPQFKADKRALALKAKQQQVQEQRDLNQVLAKKKQMNPQAHGTLAMPEPTPIFANRSVASSGSTEGLLYAEIVDSYQASDRSKFQARAKNYLASFTNSDHRDEVYYMSGIMELGERNYGQALTDLNKVVRDHPGGRKAPAALFAKGMVYKKMNLNSEAKNVLTQVMTEFPGSPESGRAKLELKLIR